MKKQDNATNFWQSYVRFLVYSRVEIIFSNMEKFNFLQLIDLQLINQFATSSEVVGRRTTELPKGSVDA